MTTDTTSPSFYKAQALREAADELPPFMIPHGPTMTDPCGGEYDGSDEIRDWLRKRADALHPESDPDGVELARRILDAATGDPVAAEAWTVAHTMTNTQFTFANEDHLQAGIFDAVESAGVRIRRELTLSREHGRIDLFTAAGVGIEVKVAGGWMGVYRQLARYAAAPEIQALVLVTTKAEHAQKLPRIIGKKPVTVVLLRDGFGVIC